MIDESFDPGLVTKGEEVTTKTIPLIERKEIGIIYSVPNLVIQAGHLIKLWAERGYSLEKLTFLKGEDGDLASIVLVVKKDS